MGVIGQCYDLAALPQGKGTHQTGGWLECRDGLDAKGVELARKSK